MTSPIQAIARVEVDLPLLPEKTYQISGKGHSDDAMYAYAVAYATAARCEATQRLREVGGRFGAAFKYLIEALDIDLDETSFAIKADGVTLKTINMGELTREFDAVIKSGVDHV